MNSTLLGYIFNYEADRLKFRIKDELLKDPAEEITKRKILQVRGVLYDPIGFISPFVVTAKMMMQECWQRGYQWDAQLDQELCVEIQEKTDQDWWNYCPSHENPSNLLTRGQKVETLSNNELWWYGPLWLVKDNNFWPRSSKNFNEDDKITNSAKRKGKKQEILTANCIVENSEPIIPIENFSDINKVYRITSYVFRFINNVKKPKLRRIGSVKPEEMTIVENFWIKKTQEENFKEIRKLKMKQSVDSSKIFTLNLFVDSDGILRVGGRLQNAGLSYNQTYPAILSEKSHLTDHIIKDCHETQRHAGVAETLTEVREKVWILKGQQRVKSNINKCVVCYRFKAKQLSQDIAPLPTEKITEANPFEVVELDFAGPMSTKDETGKAYFALYTCALYT
ncbi:uncharacterized protein LOC118205299 [Stegodyphus dumicola]|uniref:uncharacterized protein LOC118205299 n=1 Tax=Stegodyphus dumicola TaxID=202533 RepID=UPI0015AB9755|nr:uncharacterized protein LOC118205299 [Stegodyphus dumicola]